MADRRNGCRDALDRGSVDSDDRRAPRPEAGWPIPALRTLQTGVRESPRG